MKKISFVIPCHNEEANLPKLYDELDRFTRASYQVSVKETGTETGTTHPVDMNVYDFEFLFVNDGSGDGTLAIMRELRKKIPEYPWSIFQGISERKTPCWRAWTMHRAMHWS